MSWREAAKQLAVSASARLLVGYDAIVVYSATGDADCQPIWLEQLSTSDEWVRLAVQPGMDDDANALDMHRQRRLAPLTTLVGSKVLERLSRPSRWNVFESQTAI